MRAVTIVRRRRALLVLHIAESMVLARCSMGLFHVGVVLYRACRLGKLASISRLKRLIINRLSLLLDGSHGRQQVAVVSYMRSDALLLSNGPLRLKPSTHRAVFPRLCLHSLN